MLNFIKIFLILFIRDVISDKPNIVIILTDDQDATMGGMTPMKNVRRLIGEQGVTFTNSYVTSPICCPSRASLLTGLYVHNHLTVNNTLRGGCYGARWRSLENSTFAAELQRAGYNTFYAGKYLNQYGAESAGGAGRVPAGWTEWRALVGNSVYYDYVLSNDGVPTRSRDLYLTDVIRDLSVSFIENQTSSRPFLLVAAPPAPHQPFTPAPRHRAAFPGVTAPRDPNFNIAVQDKHWLLSMPPSPLPAHALPALDGVFRERWRALLSVDELVADVVDALHRAALLDNTYIIYTSDNGYHVGQFSQVYDKRQPYESDIKVPLLIRGPGIAANCSSRQPALNIDLAPTVLRLAGLQPPPHMDGRPLDLFGEGAAEDRTMLVEYYGEARDGTVDPQCPCSYDSEHLAQCQPLYECKCQDSKNNTYACIRHVGEGANYKFCKFRDDVGFIEIYDLISDPYELRNVVDETLPALKYWYDRLLTALLACRGDSCQHPTDQF